MTQRSDAVSIDPKLLPARALLDTSVVIRALGDRKGDRAASACRAFFQGMIEHRREILIAAPSVAEMLRGKPKTAQPRVMAVSVVAFDNQAAEILADRLPHDVLLKVRGASPQPIGYFTYDALIVACAIRHAANVVVSLDKGLRQLAERAKLSAKEPHDYVDRQTVLPL